MTRCFAHIADINNEQITVIRVSDDGTILDYQPKLAMNALANYIGNDDFTVFLSIKYFNISQASVAAHKKQWGIKAYPWVADEEIMQTIKARLAFYHCKPQAIIADAFALPWSKKQLTLLVNNDDNYLIRAGENECYFYAGDDLRAFLSKHNISEKKLNLITTLKTCHVSEQFRLKENVQIPSLLHFLVSEYRKLYQLNVLQADLPIDNRFWVTRKWWLINTALILGLILAISLGRVTQLFYVDHQLSNTEQQVGQLYYELFPKACQVSCPHSRIKRRLQLLQDNKNNPLFFDFLDQLSGLEHAVSVKKIIYQQRTLAINLRAKNINDISEFTKQLTRQGYVLRQSVLKNHHHINATIRIQKV